MWGGEGVLLERTNRRTRAESQQIVATRLLYCLQYPVPCLSRLQRIYLLKYLHVVMLPAAERLFSAPPDRRVRCREGTRPPIGIRLTSEEVGIVASSMDSDLEAFSHNPTDGSFAPVAVQPSARTNCPNQWFLSY